MQRKLTIISIALFLLVPKIKGQDVEECPYIVETMHVAVAQIIAKKCKVEPISITGKGGALLSLEGARWWLENSADYFADQEQRQYLIENTEKAFVMTKDDSFADAKNQVNSLLTNTASWMKAGIYRNIIFANYDLTYHFLDSATTVFDTIRFDAANQNSGGKYGLANAIHGIHHDLRGGCGCCQIGGENSLACRIRKLFEYLR